MPQSTYLRNVKAFTAAHFTGGMQTTFEVELGVFCCLVQMLDGIQEDRAHRDRVLEVVQAFLLRLRAGNAGALTLALQRLEALDLERKSSRLPP